MNEDNCDAHQNTLAMEGIKNTAEKSLTCGNRAFMGSVTTLSLDIQAILPAPASYPRISQSWRLSEYKTVDG